MAGASKELVKELREKTGAGMNDCLKALKENDGNIEKSIDYLREKGIASADKKSARSANEGLIYSYIHANGKVGTMVELNCETDFVARTEDFEQLAKDIAMQAAAMSPFYVKREDVPEAVVSRERDIYKAQLAEQKKPENVIDKIITGKLEKFYKEICLVEQPFIKDDKKDIETLIKEKISKLGENIVIKRFIRYALGE